MSRRDGNGSHVHICSLYARALQAGRRPRIHGSIESARRRRQVSYGTHTQYIYTVSSAMPVWIPHAHDRDRSWRAGHARVVITRMHHACVGFNACAQRPHVVETSTGAARRRPRHPSRAFRTLPRYIYIYIGRSTSVVMATPLSSSSSAYVLRAA
jgi:hypothetical protein